MKCNKCESEMEVKGRILEMNPIGGREIHYLQPETLYQCPNCKNITIE